MDVFAGEEWRASKDRGPVASLNKGDHYSRKTLAVQQQMRRKDMPQDHNARNRNHYGDFSRLPLQDPIDLIRGTYHAYRAYPHFFLAPLRLFTIPPVSHRHLVSLVRFVRTFSARHPKKVTDRKSQTGRTLRHAETKPLDIYSRLPTPEEANRKN